MANFDQLKQSVAALIRTNGAEEITGQIMQDVLLTIINSISGGYMFGGVAQHSGNVGNPDYNVFYLAGSGAYTGYGDAINIPNGCYGVFRYNGSWTQDVVDIGVHLTGTIREGETNGVTGDVINTALQQLFNNVMNILDTLTFTYNTPSAQQATKAMLDVIVTPTGGASHVLTTLTLVSATAAAAGLMSAEDKQKVDRMLTDFRSLSFSDTTAVADQATKIVQTLSATLGENPEAITTMTFLAATAEKAGLLSAADKAKLDALWSSGYQFAGIATPSTTPLSTTSKIFYIATESGTYFNAVTVTQGINILSWNGTSWSAVQVVGIDDEPTAGSSNLVESGGVIQSTILSHRNYEVLENYTENSTEGAVSHEIKPYNGGDLLVVYVGNLNGRIKVTGPTEHEGNGVRYSFWNTARIEDCTDENFISWTRYAENATVEIPSGAKMMALHLVREDYSGGYDGIQVNVFPHQQTGEKKIISVKGELTYTVTENSAFTTSGIVLSTSNYDIFSYTVDDSKEYCISLFSQGSGSFITAVGYYDSYGKFLGAEYIRKEGEDSILNRNFLTLPQGTVTVKVNVYKALYNVKVEEIVVTRTQGDEYTKKIYDFDGVSIMTEDELEYIDNKYLTTDGEVANSSNSKISLPIHLNSGDSVIVNTNISSACVIAEYKDDEYIPLLNAWSNHRSYSYVCNKSEMAICICGRKDMKITVCRFRYSSQLVKKEDIEPTIIGNKYINYDGSIIDSSSGSWDVYVYDINPRNLYAFTGGMGVNNTGNVIFYYDKNDSFICSFLCGSSDVAMWWDDIFIYVPLNAVKARVNVLKSIGCSLKLALRNESYIEPSEYDGLPSYYDSYMKSRAADVNKAFIYANPNTTSFCFSSDLHYPINQNLGRLVAKVLDTTKVTAFVCGGDIPNNSLNYGEEVTPEEALMMTFNEYENDLSIIRGTGKSVYTLRGNHDFAINKAYGEGSEGAVYVDYKTTRNMLMNDNFLVPGIVFNESDDVGCYFYKDFPVAKTRYIFLDTTDSNGNDGQNSKSPYVSDTQMEWIASQAVLTCPSDYNLVILSHIYIQRNCGTADSYSSYHNFDNLRTLFAAVQNKTSCTILGQSYNFSSFAPKILFHIAGHNHRDTAVFMDGFWSFTTAANYKSNELPKSPLYQQFPIDTKYVYNGKGTIYENLTDAVLVNGEVSVEVFRYGAGYDREFRQTPYTVSAGSTLQIESSMEAEDIEWWCHDSIGRSPSSGGIIIYNNDFATIDEETGLLTAIAAGYVTVVAFSESLNKVEYIGVKVS